MDRPDHENTPGTTDLHLKTEEPDFVTPQDVEALAWGRKLAAIHHSPESGIEEEEGIAYFGLSYWDLVVRYGEEEALRLWATKERHAFLPITFMERVMEALKPDMVLTTNSPRSEQAAIEVAKRRGITTMSMVDLFGIQHFHTIISDYITVLCEPAITNMRAEGVDKPDDAFLTTGNPAFDRAFEYRGPVDYDYRKKHFPALPPESPFLLWIDTPAYWKLQSNEFHTRSDAEIVQDLEHLSKAAKANNGCLLVRPHPSQSRAAYDEWLKGQPDSLVAYAGGLPLYPLLKSIDAVATYNSTVAVEALLVERRVMLLQYHPGKSDMPLAEWGLAWLAAHPDELPAMLKTVFHDDAAWKQMSERIQSVLPQERAGPKLAEQIKRILLTNA